MARRVPKSPKAAKKPVKKVGGKAAPKKPTTKNKQFLGSFKGKF